MSGAVTTASPTTLTPALRVLVGGQDVGGAIRAEFTTTSQIKAGTFSVRMAYATAATSRAAPWWDPASPSAPGSTGAAVSVPIDVQVAYLQPGQGLGAAAWQSMISGLADRFTPDVVQGTVEITGRDYLARLIDLRVGDSLKNLTSAEIATAIAGQAGLQVGQIDSTTTLVGQYYQVEHTHLVADSFARSRTAFELLKGLALAEGFDLYVIGPKLYFTALQSNTEPAVPITFTPPGALPYPVCSVIDLGFERDLTLAKGVQVQVRSWSSKKRQAVTESYPKQAGQDAQVYPFLLPPNVPVSKLVTEAQNRYADLVRHERIVRWSQPGTLTLTPRQRASVTGTGTSFDQVYWIESITREIDVRTGFVEHVTARNAPPEIAALL